MSGSDFSYSVCAATDATVHRRPALKGLHLERFAVQPTEQSITPAAWTGGNRTALKDLAEVNGQSARPARQQWDSREDGGIIGAPREHDIRAGFDRIHERLVSHLSNDPDGGIDGGLSESGGTLPQPWIRPSLRSCLTRDLSTSAWITASLK